MRVYLWYLVDAVFSGKTSKLQCGVSSFAQHMAPQRIAVAVYRMCRGTGFVAVLTFDSGTIQREWRYKCEIGLENESDKAK